MNENEIQYNIQQQNYISTVVDIDHNTTRVRGTLQTYTQQQKHNMNQLYYHNYILPSAEKKVLYLVRLQLHFCT